MATATLNPTANSGALNSWDADPVKARNGTGTVELQPAGDARIGQYFNSPFCFAFQHGHELDLGPYVGATITGCVAKIRNWFSDAATTFIVRLYAIDYGVAYTIADFAAAATLAGATLLAHATTSGVGDSTDITFTNDGLVAFLAAAAGGKARIVLASSRQEAGNTPTGFEYITSFFDSNTSEGGVAHAPSYLITYTPAAGVSRPAFRGSSGFF